MRAAGGCGVIMFLYLGIIVGAGALMWWKVFTKAGEPGWASIVPIYNLIVLIKIADRPIWWIVMFLIPIAQLIAAIFISIDIAKKFGKDVGFAVGLILLPVVFYPILGFGSAQYVGHGPIKEGFTL